MNLKETVKIIWRSKISFVSLGMSKVTNIQFEWRGSVYECTEQWNVDFNTDYDYRIFKADECKWLTKTGQYEVLEKRLRTVNEEVDSNYFKKVI